MKVAIDSGPLTGGHSVRGVGVSTKGLIESIQRFNKDKNIKIEAVDFGKSDLAGYDILHYTSFSPYFQNFPKIGSLEAKTVITIHDLIPLIFKKQYPPGIKGSIKFLLNKMLVRRADAIITVSETSKKDIVRLLDISQKKIDVIYWGVDEIFKNIREKFDAEEIRKLYKLPEKFVLYVGDVNYNKNVSTLIQACSLLDISLVIVGKQASNIDELTASWKHISGPRDFARAFIGKPHPELVHFNKLFSLIKKNDVVTTGYVPVSDMVKIYNMAFVYCQPSYYEGFGMPLIEALACELPVVVSKTQALTEIAGGSALTADPNSPKEFAAKISSLIKDSTERLHLIRAGKTRSKDFTWEETAKKTLEVYKKVTNA